MNSFINSFVTKTSLLNGCLYLLLILNLFNQVAWSVSDDLQLNVDEQISPQLRWYNLSGGSEWLSGPSPIKQKGQYQVTLAAGESISVMQPAQSWLRIVSSTTIDWNQQLQAETSSDGRLFVSQKLIDQVTGTSTLQALLKPLTQPFIVFLKNKSKKSMSFSIYRSNYELSAPKISYNKALPLATNSVDIQITPDKGLQRYYPIFASQNIALDVTGPQRVAIYMRRPLLNLTKPVTESHFSLFLDTQLVQSHELRFQEDYYHTFRIDGKRVPMSEKITVYINIPVGKHKIEFVSSSYLYMQVQQLETLYWSESNLPEVSNWLNDVTSINSKMEKTIEYQESTDYSYKKIEQQLLTLARNNMQQGGALLALSKIDEVLKKQSINISLNAWHKQQSLIKLRNKIKNNYTHFMAISPFNNDNKESFKYRWLAYVKQHLQYKERKPEIYLAQQFFQSRLNNIGKQGFHRLTKQAIEYSVIDTNHATEIQILIHKDSEIKRQETIWVQFDNNPPQLLKLHNIKLSNTKKSISAMQKIIDLQTCCVTDSNSNISVPLVDVASASLAINSHVRRIKVWQKGSESALWIALQQRRSNIYQLSQNQYLHQLKQNKPFSQYVSALAEYRKGRNKYKNLNIGSLKNHWIESFKQLISAYNNQQKNVNRFNFSEETLSTADILLIQNLADEAEKSEQWLIAIELWTKLRNAGSQEIQLKALQHIVDNLKITGQHALAKKLQLAIVFSSLPTSIIDDQLKSLLDTYKLQNNGDAGVALLSAFFVHKQSASSLQNLAMAMITEGHWKKALELLLLLPETSNSTYFESVIPAILLSALHTGWYDVFDQYIDKENLKTEYIIQWKKLKNIYIKSYTLEIKKLNNNNDKEGLKLNSVLLKSEVIKNEFLLNGIKNSKQALNKQSNEPLKINSQQGKYWVNENAYTVSHAGQVRVNNLETSTSLSYFISRSLQPLELEIDGPVHLRLQVRPIHQFSKSQTEAINSRFYIDTGKEKINFLINHNLPSKNWTLDSQFFSDDLEATLIPGMKINQEITLGAGVHHLKIAADDDILIRIQRQENAITNQLFSDLAVTEMKTIAHQSVTRKIMLNSNETDLQTLTPKALQQLQNIALQLSSQPDNVSELISRAENIYAENARAEILTPSISRIRRYGRWDLLDSVAQSDGFWVRSFDSWHAESPQSRLYLCLTNTQQQSADAILRNGASQVVSVYNPLDRKIEIQLTAISPFFILTEKIRISVQLDAEKEKIVTVGSLNKSLIFSLSRGQHNIKISLIQAPLHHRLLLSFDDNKNINIKKNNTRRYQVASTQQDLVYDLQGPTWLRIEQFINNRTTSETRFVADANQQLRLSANKQKSAYFRVFQRRENKTITPSQFITWPLNRPLENAPAEKISSNYSINSYLQRELQIKDGWNLGRQQNGTTSFLITKVDQNLIIDELSVSADKYVETELAYRQYEPVSQQWFYVAGLSRQRQQGSTTLGLKSKLRGKFDFSPIDWTVDGRLYAQNLQSGTESSVQFQFRLSQTRNLGKKFYHLPKFDMFFRSLSADSEVTNSNIDRDVYSHYKKDHPSGIRLSDTIIYRPYQDMEFYSGLTLVSNSQWSELDQYRSRMGARVQWGNIRWDINARNLQFQADENRQQASSRSVIQARALIEKWLYPRYRFELAAAFDHDVDTNDNTLRIQFSVHQSEGRGYIDYSPSETLFRNIRQVNMNSGVNNDFF